MRRAYTRIFMAILSSILLSLAILPMMPTLFKGLFNRISGVIVVNASSDYSWVNDQDLIRVEPSNSLAATNFSLVDGWNLVSFNVQPADTAIASVLSSISGSYDLVFAWDGTSQT